MTFSNRLLACLFALYTSCTGTQQSDSVVPPKETSLEDNHADISKIRGHIKEYQNDFQTPDGRKIAFFRAWDQNVLDRSLYDETKDLEFVMPFYLEQEMYESGLEVLSSYRDDAVRRSYITSFLEKAKTTGDFERVVQCAEKEFLISHDEMTDTLIQYYEEQHDFQKAIEYAKQNNPARVAEIQRDAVGYFLTECKTSGQCSDLESYTPSFNPETDKTLQTKAVRLLLERSYKLDTLRLTKKYGTKRELDQKYHELTWPCQPGIYERGDFALNIDECISAAEMVENSADVTRFTKTRDKYNATLNAQLDAAAKAAEDKDITKAKQEYRNVLRFYDSHAHELSVFRQGDIFKAIEKNLPLVDALTLYLSSHDIVTSWQATALAAHASYDDVHNNVPLFETLAARAKKRGHFTDAVKLEIKLGHTDHALATAIYGANVELHRGGYSIGPESDQLFLFSSNLLKEGDPRRTDLLRKHLEAHLTERVYYPSDVKLAEDIGDKELADRIVRQYMDYCGTSDENPWFCNGEKKYEITDLVHSQFGPVEEIAYLAKIGDCHSAFTVVTSENLLSSFATACVPLLEASGSSSDLKILSSLETRRGNTPRAETYALFARVFQYNGQ